MKSKPVKRIQKPKIFIETNFTPVSVAWSAMPAIMPSASRGQTRVAARPLRLRRGPPARATPDPRAEDAFVLLSAMRPFYGSQETLDRVVSAAMSYGAARTLDEDHAAVEHLWRTARLAMQGFMMSSEVDRDMLSDLYRRNELRAFADYVVDAAQASSTSSESSGRSARSGSPRIPTLRTSPQASLDSLGVQSQTTGGISIQPRKTISRRSKSHENEAGEVSSRLRHGRV